MTLNFFSLPDRPCWPDPDFRDPPVHRHLRAARVHPRGQVRGRHQGQRAQEQPRLPGAILQQGTVKNDFHFVL